MRLYNFKSIAVILLAVSVSAWLHLKSSPSEPIPTKTFVQNVAVKSLAAADHRVEITTFGQVEPSQRTRLSSEVGGRVIYIHPEFEVGKVVRAGTVLFKLDPADYASPVAAAEAELALAKAELEEERAKSGVARKQLINRLDSASPLALRVPQLSAAKSKVDSANAALQIVELALERTIIVAPYTAVIRERNIGLGQVVAPGEKIATLYDATKAKVILPVGMYNVPFLSDTLSGKQKELLLTDTSNQGSSRRARIDGELTYVDNDTRMMQLVAIIDDPYHVEKNTNDSTPTFKFGTFVEASIPGILMTDVYTIPQYLLRDNEIWVVNDKEQLESITVSVLREENENVYVKGDIGNGDRLVITLPDYPTNGTAVVSIEHNSFFENNSSTPK